MTDEAPVRGRAGMSEKERAMSDTRETTLGALTAADLGKRVRVLGEAGMLDHLDNHNPWGHPCVHIRIGKTVMHALPSTTPVTVYDEEEEEA